MKFLKNAVIAIVVILVASVVLLTLSLGSVVKKGVESVGSDVMGVEVTVNNVDISILEGSAQISGLSIANPEGFKSQRAFYLGEVSLKLDPMSVFSDTIKIQNISVISPEINYEVGVGKTNISVLQKNIGSKSSPKTESASAPKDSETKPSRETSKNVIIDKILISGAKVRAGVGKINKEVSLPEIKLQDIGKEGQPTTFTSASKKVMSAIVIALANSDLSSISGNIGQQLEGTGKSITDGIKGMGDKLKGVFK